MPIANLLNWKKVKYMFYFSFKILNRYKYLQAKSLQDVLNNIVLQEPVNEIILKDLYPLEQGELCLICPWGIGDTLITAGLVHKIKETYKINKVMLLVKSSHSHVPSVFPSVDRICLFQNDIHFIDRDNSNFITQNQKLAPGNYFLCHFENYAIPFLIGFKDITLFDCYKALFKIDFTTTIESPAKLKNSAGVYCDELFRKHKLRKGRTVLLATQATSITSFPLAFWTHICSVLKDRDYDIVLNSNVDAEALKPYSIYIDIPLEYLTCFTISAGNVIAIRSGICDFLSLYPINLTILYPKMEWYSGSLIQGSSLVKMGFSDTVKEFEIDPKEIDSQDFFLYLSSI